MAIGSTRSVGAKLLERTAQRWLHHHQWEEVFEEATPSHLLWPPGMATNAILFYLRLEIDNCREGFSQSNLVGFLCCLAFSCELLEIQRNKHRLQGVSGKVRRSQDITKNNLR